jgi:hypothetical protein
VIALCREKHLDFALSILKNCPGNINCHFFDFKNPINLYEKTSLLFRKQIGVVLKEKLEIDSYQLYTMQNQKERYKRFDVAPIRPEGLDLPPLVELLNRDDFEQYDEVRFKLLKWMVGDEKLEKIELKDIPVNYLLDVLTLSWLSFNGFISTREADLVLLSIESVEKNPFDRKLGPPKSLNSRAFQIAFLFTKFHMLLGDSMEVVGLKSLRVI